MNTLLNGYTTLKKSAVGFSLYRDGTGPRTLDVYTLGLAADPEKLPSGARSVYCVHVERREENGTVSEGYFYRGDSIDEANHVFHRHAGT